jgi:hypothetical protein
MDVSHKALYPLVTIMFKFIGLVVTIAVICVKQFIKHIVAECMATQAQPERPVEVAIG